MSRRRTIRRASAFASAAAFAMLTLAGTGAYALASGSATIHECASKRSGALRLSATCLGDERAVSWNIQGPPGPTGPSSAQSLSASFVHLTGKTTIAAMDVAPGAYAIQAKTVVADDAAESAFVFCDLDVNNPSDEDTSATMVGTGSARQTVTLELTHTFTSPGTVTVTCQPTSPPATTNVGTELTKIVAVKVGRETHS
jgi:hypothetical protein